MTTILKIDATFHSSLDACALYGKRLKFGLRPNFIVETKI